MARSIANKVVTNTIANAIGHFWVILVSLFLTPYIVGHLGLERYGIWAIVGVLTLVVSTPSKSSAVAYDSFAAVQGENVIGDASVLCSASHDAPYTKECFNHCLRNKPNEMIDARFYDREAACRCECKWKYFFLQK